MGLNNTITLSAKDIFVKYVSILTKTFVADQTKELESNFSLKNLHKTVLKDITSYKQALTEDVTKVIHLTTEYDSCRIKVEIVLCGNSVIQSGLYFDIPDTSSVSWRRVKKGILKYLHDSLGNHRIVRNGITKLYYFATSKFEGYLAKYSAPHVKIIIVKFGNSKYF